MVAVLAAILLLACGFILWCFCCHRRSTTSSGVESSASEGSTSATTSSRKASGVGVTTNAASGPISPPTPTAAFVTFTPEQFAQLLGKLDEVVGRVAPLRVIHSHAIATLTGTNYSALKEQVILCYILCRGYYYSRSSSGDHSSGRKP